MNDVIPQTVANDEKIIRGLFHPNNFHKKKGELLSNVFRSPAGIDEVSVIRLDYTTIDFCKFHFKKIEKPEDGRNYFGFALLQTHEIRGCNSDVVASPLKYDEYSLPQHADIKYGYIPEKNKELPVEIRLKIECIYQKVKNNLFQDPDYKNLEEN